MQHIKCICITNANIYTILQILLIDYLRNGGTGANELPTTAQPKWISKFHVHVHKQCCVVQRKIQLV